MKTTILCIILIIVQLIIATALFSANVNPTVTTSRVELFRNGAQVFKTVSFQSIGEQSELRITKIPSDVSPATIRAKALGPQKIVSITFETDYSLSEKQLERSSSIKDSIEFLSLDIAFEKSQLAALRERQDLLNSNRHVYTNGLGTEELKALLELSTKEYASLKKSIVAQRYKLQKMEKQLESHETRFAALSQIDNELAGVIVMSVIGKANSRHMIELSYLVADAWWEPIYDIRVADINSPIEIDYKAEIFQHSGEDWEDIDLMLYISNPQQQSFLKELKTWKLTYGSSSPNYSEGVQEQARPPSMIRDSEAELRGLVKDATTGQEIPFVNVSVLANGRAFRQASTGYSDGYRISGLTPGYFDLKISKPGFQSVYIRDLRIIAGKAAFVDVQLNKSAIQLSEVSQIALPDLPQGFQESRNKQVTTTTTVTSEDIGRMAARAPAQLAATVGGTFRFDDGSGMLNVRGQRSDANYYYIDGIKVRGSSSSATSDLDKGPVEIVFEDEASYSELQSELQASGKQSLKSSNRVKLVYLQTKEVAAHYVFRAIPKIDPFVYLYAEIGDWESLNLQSGKVNLFYENTFVGESFIDALTTVDTMTISLGTDKNIIVERKSIQDEWKRSAFGGSARLVGWDLIVKSKKDYPVKVRIEDQVPVSNAYNFNVDIQQLSSGQVDEKTGFLTWEFDLEPKSTENRSFAYEVKFPKGAKVLLE